MFCVIWGEDYFEIVQKQLSEIHIQSTYFLELKEVNFMLPTFSYSLSRTGVKTLIECNHLLDCLLV